MLSKDIKDLGMEEDEIIIVSDEEGNEHQCVIIDVVELNNKKYAALVPYEVLSDDEEDINGEIADLFIMEIEETDEGDVLKSILNDSCYEEVCKIIIDRLSEDFDIEC